MKYILLACLALMAMGAAAQTDTTAPEGTTIFRLPTVKAEYLPLPIPDTIACEMLVSLRESGSRAFYMTGFVAITKAKWDDAVEYLYPNKKPLPKEIKVWLCTYEQRYKPL